MIYISRGLVQNLMRWVLYIIMLARFHIVDLTLCLLLLYCTTTDVGSATYRVLETKGVAHVIRGENTKMYEAEVHVILAEDGRFLFELNNHDIYKNSNISFSFDGVDYFYVIHDATPEEGLACLSSEKLPISIFKDNVRDSLWFTLASGHFFKERGLSGEVIDIFRSPRHNINAYGFYYEVDLVNDRFPMARRLFMFKDRSLDFNDIEDEENRPTLDLGDKGSDNRTDQWQRKRKSINGGLSVKIDWDEQSNENGLTLPIEFTVTRYLLSSSARPAFTIRFRLDPWQEKDRSDLSFKPEINGPIRVRDSRLRMQDGIRFVDQVHYHVGTSAEDSEWRSAHDPIIQSQFKSAMEGKVIPSKSWFSPGLILLICIVLAAVVPLAIIRSRR